jgi:uncharacterized OB-fold protein
LPSRIAAAAHSWIAISPFWEIKFPLDQGRKPMEDKIDIKAMLGLSDEDMAKPMPKPTPWSRPFWESAKKHKLVLRKCKSCGKVEHPPYLYCTGCMSEEHEWVEASGKSTLFAYAINYFSVPFPFWNDLPYVNAIIDLPEGVRMISNVVGCEFDKLKNGMALEAVFDDVSPEFTLVKWRPAK